MVPGGKAILFTSDTHASTEYYDDARIEAVDLESGERKVVLEGSSRAVATSNGFLLFARDGSVFKVPFDLDRLEVVGTPQLALQEVLTVVVSGAVQFAVADSGVLAYVPGGKTTEVYDLVWLSPEGIAETASTEQGVFFQASLSPRGDRTVLTSATRDNQDLWILDMQQQSLSRFTFEGNNSDPVWMPDGKRIVFASNRDGDHAKPYVKAADGTGTAELIWDAPNEAFPDDVSSDGRWLVVEHDGTPDDEDDSTQIWVVDLQAEREPYPFFEDGFNSSYPAFSPDGRWLVYVSSESGQDQVYVRPFPSADGKWQISQVVSREPRWSPDGSRIFYRSIDGLKYVEVDAGEGLRVGRPILVEAGGIGAPFNRTYSFAPDGERLLALRPHVEDESHWRVHVILGWADRLLDD
jgi:serine/threonine-protein kinase